MKFVRRAAALAVLLACVTLAAHAAAPAKPAGRPAANPPATQAPARPAAPVPAAAEGDALDAIAAMVNDEAILASDVEEQVYMFVQRAGAQPSRQEVDSLRRRVLDAMIDDRLVQAEAKRQGIAATDQELNRQLDAAIADQKERLGGEAAFQEALKRENLTEAQLRERFRGDLAKQIAMEKLRQKLFPRKPVTLPEAEAYFTAHKDKFPRVPAEVRLSVIQIPPQPESTAVAAGLAKAQAVRKRLAGGERFAKVAAEVSEDPGSAQSGGDLGFFGRGRMEPAIENVAFALKNNELSQPIRSPYGWHVLQTLERDTLKTVARRDSLDADGKPVVEVHARHILIRVTPTKADAERAHELAMRVREEAAKGTNFGVLVRRYSKYDGPTGEDGDVNFMPLPSLPPNIRAGVDSLEIGQISDVLPNQSGFNIFKVTDRKPERDYTIEEIREDLPEAVAQAQASEKYEAFVKTLRAKAQIEYRTY
ncbi:MAG: peptidylprolyl isomerase [Candidatus Eisenbacteria bacterium]|uniref:Peptidylprolyl isomerase n=1 Tax=Eiseniibacteriota bacterium TaxID=2212470 RepID=A0A933S977_UNCEI|nr:peptidylprolyl isomerase [Candidatus Eisenbacteria bacterium]